MVLTWINDVLGWLLLGTAGLFFVSCAALVFGGGIGAVRLLFSKRDTKAVHGWMQRVNRASNVLWWAAGVIIGLMLLNAIVREIFG